MKYLKPVLLTFFFLFALSYLIAHPFGPYPAEGVIKTIPALMLGGLVLLELSGGKRWLMFLGFLFSAGGDYLLSVYKDGEQVYFLYGLISFFAAHVFYSITFLLGAKWQSKRLLGILPLFLFASAMIVILTPNLGEMQIPVYAYVSIITVMGVGSLLQKRFSAVLVAGAMLFVLSDSLIAINKFLVEIPLSWLWIMLTYYGGQLLIALGITKVSKM